MEDSPEINCALGKVEKNCPAHPENQSLWNSSVGRIGETGKRQQRSKNSFWIGTVIAKSDLARARSISANHYILGWIYGSFEVWVNGQYVISGKNSEKEATILNLPSDFLNQRLYLAVRITPDSEAGYPDQLARPWKEGLATADELSSFKSAARFSRVAKPFALFLLNGFLSVFFFLLWGVNRQRQEYFYFAFFGAISSFAEMRGMDFLHGFFSAKATYILDVFIYGSQGAIGVLLALSYARCRQEILRKLPLVLFLWPIVGYYLSRQWSGQVQFRYFLLEHYISSLYFLGAFFCLLQAYYLRAEVARAFFSIREKRLIIFSLGMIAMGANFIIRADTSNIVAHLVFTGFVQFLIVFFLSSTALTEYKEERKLIEKTPVSKYHRNGKLPDRLSGALLILDLKKAENLFRIGLLKGEHPVEICLSNFWSSVSKCGGTILSTEGDRILAFFDQQDCASPVGSALKATELMKLDLVSLSAQFKALGYLEENDSLDFRAGIAMGQIRPIWQELNGSRMSAWQAAGETNPFIDSSRMMELERIVNFDGSLVLLPIELTASILNARDLSGVWFFESKSLKGKHDRIYNVAAYCPAKVALQISTKSTA